MNSSNTCQSTVLKSVSMSNDMSVPIPMSVHVSAKCQDRIIRDAANPGLLKGWFLLEGGKNITAYFLKLKKQKEHLGPLAIKRGS